MMNRIRKIMNREEGASAVEYGLLVAGIAAVIVAAVIAIGGNVNKGFVKVNSSLTTLVK